MSPTRERRVLVVGAGARGQDIARELTACRDNGREVIGFIDDRDDLPCQDGLPILGRFDQVLDVAEAHDVNELILAYTPSWCEELLRQSMQRSTGGSLRIEVLPGFYDVLLGEGQIECVDDIPLVRLTGRDASPWFWAGKRVFDVAFSFLMLLLCLPVLALASAAIRLSSRGPVFFRQQRVGRNGTLFEILKLRTMVDDAERDTGPVFACQNDGRVTLVGRFLRRTRIDEVPQFWNVLCGDMSVIGPRPERCQFARHFAARVPGYGERLKVRPGITGLAQVHGGYRTSVYYKLRYDWLYIHRPSVRQELHILLRTVATVLRCAGT